MAKNTGNDYRKGVVRDKFQIYNPKNDTWVKRDASNGRFLEAKRLITTILRGVRKEKLLFDRGLVILYVWRTERVVCLFSL
ncbi:hypothetical protein MF628_002338 [Paenibacillus polymyxa]|uniref:hypothetical protein n=1 Tax=Paenibacillus polymyxa TaxID=1406 RepID=UPI002025A0FF|nr:hypothetical protein [Paenibacillus polymyxa]URJ47660.1 hypothetical protein MF628_002338 [Paenibacillus polymyxa]